MNFMNRKTLPAPEQQHQNQSPAVGAHFEYVTGLERQLQEANAMIEAQALEIDTLQRDLAVERRERRNAQQARDEFHTRAIASETAVNNAAAILVDEVRRARQRPAEPPPGPVPVDLDQMEKNLASETDHGG